MKKVKIKAAIACFMALLMLVNTAPIYVMADTEPEMWYTKNDVTIDKHILFGEDKMYTDGKSNRGFDCLVDNNTGTIFYVSTADPEVNYQNLSGNGKEIMVTVHMSQPVVIDHFKIVAGADTFKANYAHRNPAGWNLKAGNSADSCSTVLVANETIDASEGYKQNVYSFNNTTAYQYYQFTITALAGAGRSGHDVPFSNPTATCTLADIAFGGPAPVSHSDHDDITFTKWDSTNSLPSSAGNYFLDKDVTISSTWNVPSGTTNLCLNGHGIKMTGNSSVMTVSTGATLKIYDCDTETEHRFSVSNKKSNGAGFATVNDSLTSGYETFTGGYITGGKGTRVNNWSRGGAFYISGAVEMYGGTVIGNGQYGTTHGGGFSTIESGTFKMYGGSIQNNAGQCGGATRLQGAGCEILGGKIINNVVSADGGGIHVGGTIPVILKDCEISGNYAENGPGAGIWMTTTGTEVSGSTVIENNLTSKGVSNIELGNGYTIAVGTLNNDAKIGIKMNNGTGVFTSGWDTHMSGKSPANYLTSDNSDYIVALVKGEAAIGNFVASVVKGDDEEIYTSFEDAVNAWADDSTLKLLKDVTTSSTINVPSGEHTLDLGGHGIKMTGNARVFDVGSDATMNLIDSHTETTHNFTVNSNSLATLDESNGTVAVNGGYITGGNTTGSGGAFVVSGTLNINGGNIIGNTGGNGGAICTNANSTVHINSGSIAYNYTGGGGGAVFCGRPSELYISGGSIHHNKAGAWGGAIYMPEGNTCVVDVCGGSIVNNITAKNGGGIHVSRAATMKLSGNPQITDNKTTSNAANNVNVAAGAVVTIIGELDSTASVGIKSSNTTAVVTSGWPTYMNGKKPGDYFTADAVGYEVQAMRNGEVCIGPPHTHSWSYAADGDTITATCSGYESGVCPLEKQTIQISAQGKTYDGSAVTATLKKSDDWTTDNGLSVPTIQYSGNTDAGTYTASITLGEATASAEFTIDEKSMNDEVSAAGCTVNYDGNAHSITVTKPEGATVKYGTSIESINSTTNPTYTNAGEYNVYYEVSRKNYITVIGVETVKINKINATVTIVGNNSTVDYDGTEHTITGYVANANTSLYDVSKDFTFSGDATASRTNAGTTNMGLAPEQFANTNSNFATVTFEVTDGYVTVNTVDAVITTAPATANPIYNGSKLKLVKAGKVDGGTLFYAIGENPKSAPDESSFKTSIPTAKKTGSYYVWYRVAADKNHFDIAPQCIKVVIAEEDWVTLSGVLYQKDGKTPIEDATITLMKGSNKVDYEITATDGKYQFIVPAGFYNIVTTYNGKSETTAVELFKTKKQDISMLGGNTESVVDINSDTEGFDVVVGGLNEEAKAIRIADGLKDEQNLSLKMTVEAKTVETANNSKAFTDLSVNTTFMFFDVQLEKTVDSKITVLKNSRNVLEIAVPYEKINRKDLAAYYCDGSKVKKLKESDSGEDGTFRIDKKNGFVYIYSTSFSTFAIGYTPYYTLDSNVVLGSFGGNVNVSLVGMGGEGVYTLENVSLNKIGFANVPKGRYKMTVTWTDGVENTLTMPITVS